MVCFSVNLLFFKSVILQGLTDFSNFRQVRLVGGGGLVTSPVSKQKGHRLLLRQVPLLTSRLSGQQKTARRRFFVFCWQRTVFKRQAPRGPGCGLLRADRVIRRLR